MHFYSWRNFTSKVCTSLSSRSTIDTCLHRSVHSSLRSISSVNFTPRNCIEMRMQILQPIDTQEEDKYSSKTHHDRKNHQYVSRAQYVWQKLDGHQTIQDHHSLLKNGISQQLLLKKG